MQIALATCRPLPEPDPDEQLTLDALRGAGLEASMLAWNDGDPCGFDALVLRSTWDYYLAYDAFVEWLHRAASCSRLFNPLAVVLGNLHKRYLFELLVRGVPVVPTALIGRGAAPEPPEEGAEDRMVVKPAVGASSWKTRVAAVPDAVQYVQELSRGMDVLLQPFLASVERHGERSVVWIDGEFTHKVVKLPRFEDGEESVTSASPVDETEREIGEHAIGAYMEWVESECAAGSLPPLAEPPLYARVDLMELDDGQLVVSELEMTEPSLFFLQEPSALRRFVGSLLARLS